MTNLKTPFFLPGLLLPFLNAGCVSDKTSRQSDICSVHHVRMKKTTVEIVYGLPHASEFRESKAAERSFPHGRDYILGGCVPSATEKKARIYLCPECTRAREVWLKEKGCSNVP